MSNKKKLVIKSKKLVLKEFAGSDDYGEAMESMTTGLVKDVAAFAKESGAFWKNMAKFLIKNSWYTFRAKVLGNMSQKEFEEALKSARVDFVDETDRNIASIDSNTKNMLSKAGVPESEINTYLLGMPGYSVVENINLSDVVTGRMFEKSRDSLVDPIKFTTAELITFYMFEAVLPELKKEKPTNSTIKKLLESGKYVQTARKVEIKVKTFLNKMVKEDAYDVLEYIRKTKSEKILDVLKKCNVDAGKTYSYDRITDEGKAKSFIGHAKKVFVGIKEKKVSETKKRQSKLVINNKNINLIKEFIGSSEKENYVKDDWSTYFRFLMKTFAISILFMEKNSRELIEKIYKENLEKNLEKLEKEMEAENPNAPSKIKAQRKDILEKFVCNAAFEVYHYLAEIDFVKGIIDKNYKDPAKFNESLLNSYKKVMGGEKKVFAPLETEIKEFVNKSTNNKYIKEAGKKFSELNDEYKNELSEYAKSPESLRNKIKEVYDFKKNIELIIYAEGYLNYLNKLYKEDKGIPEFKEYAENVLKEEINKTFCPKNILNILEGLSSFDVADISRKFGEVEQQIINEKNNAETRLKDLSTEADVLKKSYKEDKENNKEEKSK